MSNLFGDLDWDSVSDDPFGVGEGTFNAVVSKVERKESKDGTKVGLVFTYTVESDDENNQKNVQEWKTVPEIENPSNMTAEERQALSFVKQRLKSLGIPEDRMNAITPEDLEGIPVTIVTKKNGEYTNVSKVTRRSESVSDNPLDSIL